MSLLHVSINAHEPESVAKALAQLLGGEAYPFPSCPGGWIAFSSADDGTAIEVYPITQTLTPGDNHVEFGDGGRGEASGAHAAVVSPMSVRRIMDLAKKRGWAARVCDRGPFECVEVWIENRQLIEVLDAGMAARYRRDMTTDRWVERYSL